MLRICRISVAMMFLLMVLTTTSHALPDGAVARLGKGRIEDVSFSPDGSVFVVASSCGIYLYDTFSQEEIRFVEADTEMTSVAFSPDGSLLASGGGEWPDYYVMLWDVETLVEVATLAHSSPVRCVAFSPDGSLLASGGGEWPDYYVMLWDVETLVEVTLLGHADWVHSIAFSPDGKLLASGGDDSTKLWDVATHQEVATFKHLHPSADYVAFSPDGKLLASGGDDSTKLWDVSTYEEVATFERSNSVTFSPDGKLLASGSWNTIRIRDVATHQEMTTLTNSTWVDSVAFSPDGSLLISENGYIVNLWNVETRKKITTLEHSTPTFSIDFSPDGKLLATGGYHADGNGILTLWDVSTNQEVATLKHSGIVYSIAFSPDGKLLASGSGHTIKIWDVSTHQEVATLLGHTGNVYSIAFSPDGKLLASGDYDRTAKLWDVSTHQEVATFLGGAYIAFSPDGKLLAGAGKNTKLWDVSTHQEVAVLEHPGSLAFSPDGKLLASGGYDCDGYGIITLWDVSTHQEVATLKDSGSVHPIAFSPDSKLLASVDRKSIKLWDVATCQPVAILRGHHDSVYSIAFSPDNILIASGDYNGTTLLWDTTPFRVSRIKIPSPITTLKAGGVQQFTMNAYNTNGQAVGITNIDVTWAVDGNIGTIDESGLFTATTIGNGSVTAILKTDTAITTQSETLTVEAGDPVELTIPQPSSQLRTGEQYQFTVTGKDAYSNDVAVQNSDVIWSVVDGVGSISTMGLFMSTEAGSISIKATLKADANVTATTQPFTIEVGQAVEPDDKLTTSWSDVRDKGYAEPAVALPSRSALRQNYPNPFNPETWIPYQLAEGSEVRVWIYGIGGALIRQLDLGHKPAGFYLNKNEAAYWDGCGSAGEPVASGVYFYSLQAGEFAETKKMIIVR